jgi:ATP-dependent protease ClpP protease subunit
MPTWSEVLTELKIESAQGNSAPFDYVRRKYLKLLSDLTNRNVILYATAFTQKGGAPELLSVTEEDVQGMMEVSHGLEKKPVDLIIHSPGGSPEAAEGIVEYLHAQFHEIRVIIPQIAMSAATMIACSGASIVMGKHSNIGPVDPQLIINTPNGPTSNPAKAIIDQFYKGIQEVNVAGKQAWAILLHQYGPSIITQCENYIEMSENLVRDWLGRFMFKDEAPAKKKPIVENIASFLANHDNFKSHGRHISREKAESQGLKIEYLEKDPKLQDLVLSVFHATTHTFSSTPAMKIIENQNGKAFIKLQH